MPGFYKPERGVVTTSRKKPKSKKEPKKRSRDEVQEPDGPGRKIKRS